MQRAQRLAALGLVVAGLAIAVWRCAASPDVVWIWQHGDAAWITDPRPVDATVQQYGRPTVPVATFARRFRLEAPPARAELSVWAARAHRVRVNGVAADASPDPDPDWRRGHREDVARWLRAGENEIEIEVWNPRGPPLLRARLVVDGRVVATGADWTVRTEGGPARAAVLPDDTRLHPSAPAGPRPGRALAARATVLVGMFAALAVALAALGPALARHQERLPTLALAAVACVWGVLFVVSFVHVPLTAGFDATHHLRYVERLREGGTLPRPDEGWSTFHPPLYYALVAALQEVARPLGPRAVAVAAKLVSFAAGLGQALLARGLAARLVPGRPALAAGAVLFAGCLPLDLYSSAFVSNEPLHAFWFGLATLICVALLRSCRVRVGGALALGAVLGLALLTKVTALVAAAVAGAFVLARAAFVERARPGRLVALAAALALPAAGLAGWYYLRNWQLYGTPVVANWNLPGMPWWSQPGFHTWSYYLGFGESLRLPVLSGFHSLADSLYSSFWGDGWAAGRATAARPPEFWNWQWAAIGYWLALPATAVLAIGIARSIREAFAAPAGRSAWSFVLALEGALAFAFLQLTVEVPYFGQAKALYLLGLAAPLSVQFALGAEACDRALARVGGSPAATAGRAFWLTTGVVFWLSFAGP